MDLSGGLCNRWVTVFRFEIGRAEFERAVKLLQVAQTEEAKRLKKGWTP